MTEPSIYMTQLEKKIEEHEREREEAQAVFEEMRKEIEDLKEMKGVNTPIDSLTERFNGFHALAEQPPSNLVDLLLAKGAIERAAYLEELNVVITGVEERLREVYRVQEKLELADKIVR